MSGEHQLGQLDRARWDMLADREALGEALDEHERGFMRRYEADHPELAGERAVFEGAIAALCERLDEWESEPEDLLEREAAAALARYRHEGRGTHHGQRVGSALAESGVGRARSQRRALVGAAVTVGLAAAALALWFGLPDQGPAPIASTPTPPPTGELAGDPAGELDGSRVDPVVTSARLSMLDRDAVATLGQPFEVGMVSSADLLGPNPSARACLSWTDPVAVVCFEGQLRSIASEHPGERRLRLDDGRLVVALAPLGPGQRFTIETPTGAATALGTVFAVEVHEGRSWLTVLEGRVELRDPTPRSVYAGGRTSFRGEVPGDEPTPLIADTIPSALTELVGYAELLRARPGAAALTIPSATELGLAHPSLAKRGLANLRVDGQLVAGPAQLALAAGPHTVELFDAHGELILEHRVELDRATSSPGFDRATSSPGFDRATSSPVFDRATSSPGLDRATSSPGFDANQPGVDLSEALPRSLGDARSGTRPKPTATAVTPTGPRKTAKQLAEAAQIARKQRDYPRTAVLYRELLDRYPDSPEAANVPVRLGDLLAANGDPDGALAAYELYLARGAKQLRPEAEYGRIQALRALGRPSEARKAIDAFIRARPDDYRSAELHAALD